MADKELLKKAKLSRLADIQKRTNELLVEKKNYIKGNRIEFFNKPKEDDPANLPANPAQLELLEAWKDPLYKVFTYTGGNRIGKTAIGSGILSISTIMGVWPWDTRQKLWFPHNKPRKIRIVGQDWEVHIKKVIIPELYKWWPERRKVTIKKNSLGVEALWTDVETGSTIEILSNKQDSEVHEGWKGDLIIYDEPPRRKIRVANARGLIDREGRELFCMTLLKEAWVDKEVIKAVDEDGRPDKTVFNVHGDIYTNVGFGITEEGVKQFAKTLTDDEKKSRLDGVPSYMTGLVAKDFRRKKHLIERFQIPTYWPVDVGIDIHPRKEQAILFVANSPQQLKYCCFEIKMHGDGKAVGDAIVRTFMPNGLTVNRVVCDPLAKGDSNSGNTTYDKINEVLMAHGMFAEIASKDKVSGVLEINKHLKGPNNEPSLFVFDDMIHTIGEFEAWMYDEETQKPKKEDDDFMEDLYRILLLDTKYEDDMHGYEGFEQPEVPAQANSTAGWY